MTPRIERKGLLKLMTVGLLFAGLATANTLITPTGVDWTRGGGLLLNADGVDVNEYFAGVIFITLTDGTQTFNRDTFCADLFTGIGLATYGTTVLRPDQVQGKSMGRVSWLVDNALFPTQGPVYPSELPSTDWVINSFQGMGMQLAIWDLTSDNGDGFNLGRVRAATNTDAAVLAWAQSYLASSLGMSSDLAYVYDNVNLGNGQPAQMLVGPRFLDGGPAPVPEPSTLGLAGAAMIAIVASVRRKNRLKQAA